ncbi:short chain dehydrogenase [Nocardioides scoriae]|uniref:Short chain dehydrogenase n=1 Tax=Nocardioides scoriae TaxID=642780 RepID=A0A1H1WE94_9ACTN|nr:SDR family NAD(P)-dependent oxidoreductase [Nocardioides scoriae]SDS95344.1 short chain dehydrogenase [Nocardioides scoriae]
MSDELGSGPDGRGGGGRRGWSPDEVPDLAGRRALVTGATGPTGREVVLTLARHGAEVVVADRDLDQLAALVRTVDADEQVQRRGTARPVALRLDLADLDSVRDGAEEVGRQVSDQVGGAALDLLVLDEGHRDRSASTTADGFDAALAARFLGPFALVGRLLPLLTAARSGRVVTVVSPTHKLARELSADDLAGGAHGALERRTAWAAPAEAALAGLLLALELDRRARDQRVGSLRSVAALAGLDASSALDQADGLRQRVRRGPSILQAALGAVEQRSALAPWPVLMAATADLPGGTVVGPGGPLGLNGGARIVNPPRTARDRELRAQLWTQAEEATDVRYLS